MSMADTLQEIGEKTAIMVIGTETIGIVIVKIGQEMINIGKIGTVMTDIGKGLIETTGIEILGMKEETIILTDIEIGHLLVDPILIRMKEIGESKDLKVQAMTEEMATTTTDEKTSLKKRKLRIWDIPQEEVTTTVSPSPLKMGNLT